MKLCLTLTLVGLVWCGLGIAVETATLPPDPKPRLRSPKDQEFRLSLAKAIPTPKQYYLVWDYPQAAMTNGLWFEVWRATNLRSNAFALWATTTTNRVPMSTTGACGFFIVRASIQRFGTNVYSGWNTK